MTSRNVSLKRLLALGGAALLFPAALQAAEIANSITEFSGTQGQNGWYNGYRAYIQEDPENYDPDSGFIAYSGGPDAGEWDGFSQQWTGSVWDLNTAGAAPWTFQGPEALHPNGDNNGEIHWNIRRWVADELTGTTPLGIVWNTRKENAGGGNGVTGILFRNGEKVQSMFVPGTDAVGKTYTNYFNAAKGDKFDLVLTSLGNDGTYADGADGSFNYMKVDTTLPEVPRQPDNSIFIPANSPDTDGDGLPDFWENVFASNLTTMNGTGDLDGDGLTNRQELDLGLDPSKVDTDGDGLRDNVETNTGTYVSATNTGTNPKVVDTDGDGLSDGSEVNGTLKSNPLLVDTDEDTFSDGDEVRSGHNPSDASNNPDTTSIANSETEFSGTQGSNDWEHGYRVVSGDGAITDYAPTEFVAFAGGEGMGDWDGVNQQWSGTAWDLNTAAAGPWTELAALNAHPNTGSPLHWVVRRWNATELTKVTPLALTYHIHKSNTGCGNGVTAGIYVNGKLGDSVNIAGNDGVGTTRTYYANVAPTDKVDLILSPRGADNSNEDACDSSAFRLVVDPTIPENPLQPNGSVFIPANASDSDADGIPDAWERLHADNLTTFSRTGDFDNDGLNDLGEYTRDTDPKSGDTDNDGLGDNVETGTGTYVSPTNTGTSAKVADTDGDGINDATEVNGTVKTNPTKADSDDDGFSDSAEIAAGTDPNSSADNPLTFVIANSQAEFSGVQGQNGWSNGYRNFSLDGGEIDYDPATAFIPFAGGTDAGDWDGVNQTWTGSIWDLNTAASGPWTEQGPLAIHPNGANSAPNEEHWTIRRWVASELTQTTPVAIIWNVRKNANAGDGVTGLLYINGKLVDSRTVPGSDTTGETRRFYVDLKAGDIVDLAVSPQGVNDRNDGSDGSSSWFWVDTRLPREPRQPNGSLFIPAGSPDTDGDGLIDFWERVYANDLTTFNGTGDSDNDTLTNSQEFTRDTNPLLADTDSDGLSDAVETGTGTWVSATNTGSSPRRADTDGDGLNDQAEVVTHGTDPNKADTDDDTFSDASEVASGHNPKDAGSNPNTSSIADSRTEFSGTQGQDSWFYGYRNVSGDGGGNNYDDAKFIQFAGGEAEGEWDGVNQIWNGTMWDLNTAAAAPWTELGVENSHPNGPSPLHWSIRRWVASELTAARPLAIRYHVRKAGSGGTGVTGALYINGQEVDSVAIAGNNTAGVTRTFYAVVNPGDKIDLVHKSVGPTGDISDGSDGSILWMSVDTVLPPNPVQPDGTPFNPGGTPPEITGITMANGQPTIRWSSEAGATYTIQTSTTLLPGSWTDVKTGHASQGAETSYTDTAATGAVRFYRIVRQ